ncbi:putative ubiquitin c-terminal hydrolase protein [Neofusicoccum parvum UCRNP2]|uniref:Ubiquitin carboxyl-terminal hydrolase n=1 Tax=Botryosphaeria parva (strain UCR-NP2) TaxID=1287680 RepID=R1GKQ5_BOTPV|nr:putative ubiquitin c-terminal hydrolase protein [Neofusicoccum parvum UCRNP2]
MFRLMAGTTACRTTIKFLVTYGEDCDELLMRLGFSKKTAQGEQEAAWLLPSVTQEWDRFKGDALRDRLDDSMQELMCLIDRMPHSVKQELKRYNYQPKAAREYLERAVGAINYPKKNGYTASTQGVEDHPYYAGLGACGGFSDGLLVFAYDRQVATDPQNQSYYYECLADLAGGRRSEELDMKKVMEESKGVVSRKDALQALRRFNLEPDRFAAYTDDYIINQFRVRVANVGSYEVPELREHLRKIGVYRQSQEIINAAGDIIQTYEQALSWLGAEAGHGDDQVIAVAGLKKSEEPSSEPKIAEAIKIIADHRDSEALRVWLQTGEIKMGNDPELEKTKAFSAFGISNHQGGVDPEMLELTLSDLKERDPSKSDEYDRYAAIIRAESGKGPAPPAPPKHPLDQWPVGIENLGNTCYLNAILQFLFTIKPLREFVLNIDEHLMEINDENIRNKRVGSRMVTADEQDASEILINILLQLSYAIRPEAFGKDNEQLDFIKELFYGEEATSLSRKDKKTTEQTSLFNTQYVTVVDKPKNIYEAIDDALDMGAIEDSDNAEKWTTITRAPPILKIDVKRLGFDKEKKQTVRSENHLQLEDTIYIDRYLRDEAILRTRMLSWKKKAKLKALRDRRAELAETKVGYSASDALRAASEFVKSVGSDESNQFDEQPINGTFQDEMATKAEETRKAISDLDESIGTLEAEISSLFTDMTSKPYKLHSLFIHRGGTGGGHYLVSIRDFKAGMWRNYNDETITEVTDVDKNIFGQGDTYSKIITTCVVYVRADLKYDDQDLVEALHREPIQPPPSQEDVNMASFSDEWQDMTVTEGIDPTAANDKLPAYDEDGYDTSQLDFKPSEGQW